MTERSGFEKSNEVKNHQVHFEMGFPGDRGCLQSQWQRDLDQIKFYLGPLLWETLKTQASCCWCGMLLVGCFVEGSKICPQRHPVCERCCRGHSKCKICQKEYLANAPNFVPEFLSRWNGIPLIECPLRTRQSYGAGGAPCGTWCSLPEQQRNLGLWLQSHFRLNCDADPVICVGCLESVTRGHFEHHYLNECTHRHVVCEACHQSYLKHQEQEHQELCSRMMVPCPHPGCPVVLPRMELRFHLNVCEWKPCQCHACGQKGIPHCQLVSHLRTCDMIIPVACPVARSFCSDESVSSLPSECQGLIPKFRMKEHLCVHQIAHNECILQSVLREKPSSSSMHDSSV